MILSKSVEYALRIMAQMAIMDEKIALRAVDLAKETKIPIFYISKVLSKMVAAELLIGTKGHGGGFRFSKSLNNLRFIDIFEAIEGPIKSKRCVMGWHRCSSTRPCPLHFRWSELNDAFQAWARKTTLADVKNDAKQLDFLNSFSKMA